MIDVVVEDMDLQVQEKAKKEQAVISTQQSAIIRKLKAGGRRLMAKW
jgi:hypothetical protein